MVEYIWYFSTFGIIGLNNSTVVYDMWASYLVIWCYLVLIYYGLCMVSYRLMIGLTSVFWYFK